MINERAILTVRREFKRPEAASVGRFAGAATVHLVDAMGGRGGLGKDIKPINPDASSFAGPALTCRAGADDTLALLAALALAEPGDVIVAANEGFQHSAVVGDLFAAIAKSAGAAAIVTDGLARDSVGIVDTGLPVFAGGVTPNSAARSGPGAVGSPIVISDVAIQPGDLVVGDRDGVVVVPQTDLDHVYLELEQVRRAEADYPIGERGEVRVPEFVIDLLASDRVVYLD